MALGPTYTISGSPITTDSDPNSSAPPGARIFSPPAISVGPAQLWVYRKDGGAGTFITALWFHDATNSCWVSLGSLNLDSDKVMQRFTLEFGITTDLFLQVVNPTSLSVTKCPYGFGIGSIAI